MDERLYWKAKNEQWGRVRNPGLSSANNPPYHNIYPLVIYSSADGCLAPTSSRSFPATAEDTKTQIQRNTPLSRVPSEFYVAHFMRRLFLFLFLFTLQESDKNTSVAAFGEPTASKGFEGSEQDLVNVNGDRYRAMITNFFIPELNNSGVQELWFQQDGATYHTARATIDLLKDTFGDYLISRFGPVNWPPRSCDLTPLDYFLWGYVIGLCG
ncbi:putative transposable element [Trichonephila clavipes]|nr:putative transposable element [Trichonephila clavipes]